MIDINNMFPLSPLSINPNALFSSGYDIGWLVGISYMVFWIIIKASFLLSISIIPLISSTTAKLIIQFNNLIKGNKSNYQYYDPPAPNCGIEANQLIGQDWQGYLGIKEFNTSQYYNKQYYYRLFGFVGLDGKINRLLHLLGEIGILYAIYWYSHRFYIDTPTKMTHFEMGPLWIGGFVGFVVGALCVAVLLLVVFAAISIFKMAREASAERERKKTTTNTPLPPAPSQKDGLPSDTKNIIPPWSFMVLDDPDDLMTIQWLKVETVEISDAEIDKFLKTRQLNKGEMQDGR